MPAPHELPLAQQFARISRDLLAQPAPDQTLDRVVELAVATIASADECCVLLFTEHGVDTAASSSPLAERLGALHERLGQGPGMLTQDGLATQLVDDLHAQTCWPQWSREAAASGVGSLLSVGLPTGTNTLGSLTLYARTAHAFDHTDVAVASIFARHAANALLVAGQTEDYQAALRSRQTIGVAQGMLMQRYGLTLDQSFEVLRRYSNEHNIKVRDLADHLAKNGPITSLPADLADATADEPAGPTIPV